MSQRSVFRRAVTWAGHLLHAGQDAATLPLSPRSVIADDVPISPHPAPACASPDPVAQSGPDPDPPPLEAHHREGLLLAKMHQWGRAQREFELAVRAAPRGEAVGDLESLRTARRQLRVLRKWPRDLPALRALGHAYFELGLGADAERVFRQVLALAPNDATASFLLTLEYVCRDDLTAAAEFYAQARASNTELPALESFLAGLRAATTGATSTAAVPAPVAPGHQEPGPD